jgi:hypothetical protein
MALSPAMAGSRRLLAIVGLALVLVAVVGALIYASGDVGNGCGSGWAASRKAIPSPLLTDAEKDALVKAKRNPYEAASEKQRPYLACRRAGNHRLVQAGLIGGLPLVAVGGLLGFLYWPRREDLSDETIFLDDEPGDPGPVVPKERTGWPGR